MIKNLHIPVMSKEVLSFINSKSKLSVLDCTFGGGGHSKKFLEEGHCVTAIDQDENSLKIAKRLKKKFSNIFFHKANFKNIDKLNLNKHKFDLILLADVLEHIKNDKKIVQNLSKNLKNDGFILITVPSYKILFSKKDLILGHHRRYSKTEILNLFRHFKTVRLTFFNSILFFPISFIILFFKLLKIDFIDEVEKSPNRIVNFILFKIFTLERRLINHCNLPFGISMLGLFQKK